MICNVIQSPMQYIKQNDSLTLFLAGGISNCADWQSVAIKQFQEIDTNATVTIFNPRRDNFDVTDASIAKSQIVWEFELLNSADLILFYFAPETLCPITLYELGLHAKHKNIWVACHPDYQRKFDVETQLKLLRYDFTVYSNLCEMIDSVIAHIQFDAYRRLRF